MKAEDVQIDEFSPSIAESSSDGVKDESMSPDDDTKSSASSENASIQPLAASRVMYPLRFPCPYCGIRFSNENTLKAHLHGYCTKINREVDAAQQSMCALFNAAKGNLSLTDQGCAGSLVSLDRPRSLDVPPYAVVLEALCHPERLDTSRCFRTGDICYVAVHLNRPHVISPPSSPTPCEAVRPRHPSEALDLSRLAVRQTDGTKRLSSEVFVYSGPEIVTKDVLVGEEPLDLSRSRGSPPQCYTGSKPGRPDYQCSTCGYLATTIRGLRLHERVHSNNSVSVNREFHDNCSKGMMSSRKRSYSSGGDSMEEEPPTASVSRRSVFRCPQCGIQFSNPTTLTQHCLYYCRKNPVPTESVTAAASLNAGTLLNSLTSQMDVEEKPTVNGEADRSENRCDHCNINFCHRASYIAHKLHYCRAASEAVGDVKSTGNKANTHPCAAPTA